MSMSCNVSLFHFLQKLRGYVLNFCKTVRVRVSSKLRDEDLALKNPYKILTVFFKNERFTRFPASITLTKSLQFFARTTKNSYNSYNSYSPSYSFLGLFASFDLKLALTVLQLLQFFYIYPKLL